MKVLDDIERDARAKRITGPATVLVLVEVIRAATVLRKRLEYPEVGVGLTEKRRELLAFDAAMAKLESGKL